jgi:carbamoyl-phosphate synthase large subunit
MTRRLLVLGAGTGASNNLIGSLRAGDPTLYIVGCHADRFVLKKSTADRNYLVLATEHWDFLASLRRVVLAEGIELVIPNSDADVRAVARRRGWCPSRLFLPRASVISRCQDKYVLSVFLRRHGVPAPRTWPIRRLSDVDRVFRHVGPRQRLWCRIRTGGGSRGAIPVVRAEQARSWIAYWRDMRGVATEAFTLSEYLPGRDFAAQGLWRDGELLLLKVCERLSYFGGGSQPSGTSSTPALGKLVADPRVTDICAAALRALDRRASGVFSVDLKEDAGGQPCVTEINAGRFCMITPIFDRTGTRNMALTYLQLAYGEPVTPGGDDPDQDYYLVRDLDTTPGIFREDALFDDIRDARRDVVTAD